MGLKSKIKIPRRSTSKPLDADEEAIGYVRIRVYAAKHLVARDRNGKSDPYVRLRTGNIRAESDVVKATLSPAWGRLPAQVGHDFTPEKASDKEFAIEFPVYRHSLLVHNVEIVLWDKDKFSKSDYLGEANLGVERWFQYTEDADPCVMWEDPKNAPRWIDLVSSRTSKNTSGAILIKFGFVPQDASTPTSGDSLHRTMLVSSEQVYSRIIRENVEDKLVGARLSRLERVKTAPPTEGVGTLRRGQLPGDVRAAPPLPGDSTSDEELEDDDYGSSTSSFTDVHDALEDPDEDDNEPLSAPLAELSIPGKVRVITSSPEEEKRLAQLESDEMTPTSSQAPIQFPPLSLVSEQDGQTPKVSTPEKFLQSESNAAKVAGATSSGRRLGFPAFMKRGSSSRSVTTLSTLSTTAASSASDLTEAGPDTASVQPKKRFGLKRRDTSDSIGGGEESGSSRRKRFGMKKRSDTGGDSTAGEESSSAQPESKKKKLRRKPAAGYNFGAGKDDIVGIVFLEVSSAKALPRWKAASQVTYDMDPFCVVSFGHKVFRTRVIRHSLNPTWNERLFFHVRRHEIAYGIDFRVYDWDRLSGNDDVATANMKLGDLLEKIPVPEQNHLYKCNAQGFLLQDQFSDYTIPLNVVKASDMENGNASSLSFRAKFTPYAALRQQFWRQYMRQFDTDGSTSFSQIELVAMLDSLGSTLTPATIDNFFTKNRKTTSEELTFDEVIIELEKELTKDEHSRKPILPSGYSTPLPEANPSISLRDNAEPIGFTGNHSADPLANLTMEPKEIALNTKPAMGLTSQDVPVRSNSGASASSVDDGPSRASSTSEVTTERVINIKACPLCHKPRLNKRSEVDIITHLAICASQDWANLDNMMVGNFVTSQQAHRKWIGKFVSRVTKGAYQLGADSGNILVQDRLTGQLLEEKMQVYVRLGIRFMYRGMGSGVEGSRIRRMFASMSVKQGAKFDSPDSVSAIAPFIAFHNLDMGEVKDPLESFKTFNEFFYRKLKDDARPIADPGDSRTLVSSADSRMNAFATISDATRIWIKGKDFQIKTLLGDSFKDIASNYDGGSLAIFRLAPQDYHRYHSPVDGKILKIKPISGHYYTVNPMAIRSSVDVYGENKREVILIDSPVFGKVICVCVGAMLVASITQTVKEGQQLKRGDEIGYYSFGGSTNLFLFEKGRVQFDADILENSSKAIETLVRVGMRIGRSNS